MDISIVTGTFNRLLFLKKMVASARSSLAGVHGLIHEFVVVDGGSSDGSLDWCRAQPDIRLIEHGALLGGVRAFNDGAYASKGQYVLLANDDIDFVGDGIFKAWVFMEQRPDVGIGCFYQDRNRQQNPEGNKWHVEMMPVVLEDMTNAHWPYGQVCLVRKALGDKLGWWGDYLHTYGGDNELSARCYEAGWKIAPLYWRDGPAPEVLRSNLDGACIHDNEPKDALRAINNVDGKKDPRSVNGQHPDSFKWGQRWLKRWQRENAGKRNKLFGPLVRTNKRIQVPINNRDRILYLPIYERGWAIQKEQKRGLREALARVAVVYEYDYVTRGAGALTEIAWQFRPDICLFQLHGPDLVGPADVQAIRSIVPDAWFVNWNGDYWPENLLSKEGIELAKAFDVQLTVNRQVLQEYRDLGINVGYWQIGWEPDGVGHKPRQDDHCDVVFLGNGYSKARQELVRRLKTLPYNLRLWGNGWPDGWAVGQCTYDFITGCRAYQGARFSIGDSQWPDTGFVSNRVFQALAAGGALLCHEWFKDMEQLGMVDGQTCVVWRTFTELQTKIAWYADHESERTRIAEAGRLMCLDRHSFDRRVEELLTMRPGNEWEDWR